MSVQKPPEHGKNPARGQNMDDMTWDEHSPASGKDNEHNSQENIALEQATNEAGSIQEDTISASTNLSTNKNELDLESAKNASVASETNIPSQEEIEAAIVKNKPEETPESGEKETKFDSANKNELDLESTKTTSVISEMNIPNQEKSEGVTAKSNSDNGPEPEKKKSKFSFTAKADKKITSKSSSTPPPILPRPGRVAQDPERPVRGYGVLTFFPLLTLTILLFLHVASFIYSSSDQLLLENPQQISVAKSINLSPDIFIPTLDGEVIKDISPTQFWFLGGIFKLSPFSEVLNLNIAGAIAALLMLWAVYLLCKAIIPKNKGVAFSAGLVLLSSVIYLGGAWFFRSEMLGIALITLSQAMLFKGLQRPSGAYLWFIPAMILAALAILTQGLIMGLALFIPLALYIIISGNLRRLSSPDLIAGLFALIIVLGAWLGGAIFFLGAVEVSSYLLPFNLVLGGTPITFSLYETIVFAGVLLLPWLFLLILLIDRILIKIPSIPGSLKTEKGQGTLFAITILIAAITIVGIDRLAHPVLSLILLPPLAILAARAVLYMSRSRARIFTIFTALLFVALTALLALKAGGFGNTILPWNITLWAIIPLLGSTAFCTLFLARAAQVSAGKTQLLVYAICWLLLAQVFLFGGMPATAKYLKFSEIQTAIQEKISQAPWTVAYLNTPTWASGYNANSQSVNSWQQVEELSKSNPVLVVMPESDWKSLDKKQYPFRKIESQILLLTPYVLAESSYSLSQMSLSPETTPDEQPATEILPTTSEATEQPETSTSTQNATVPAVADQPETSTSTQNATVPAVADQPETSTSTQNATVPAALPMPGEQVELEEVVVATENATQPIDTPLQEKSIIPEGQNATVPAEESTVPLIVPEALPETDSSVDAQTTPDSVTPQEQALPLFTHEEIISTTYTPKALRELDLIYGDMPGLPELSIIVRYHELKQVN